MKTLELSDLSIGYHARGGQSKQIGPTMNFDALKSELIALIGPNGIGKSTLLRTIARLQPFISGTILINNQLQQKIDRDKYSTLLSFVSTEPLRVPNLSVYQLIALGRFPYTNWLGNLTNTDKKIIEESIEQVKLNNLKTTSINEISDSERQRAQIARALAQDTPIIIMDEPTAYLDLINKYEIVHILRDLAHKKQKTVIFSTHDLNIALTESDKIWLMNDKEVKQGAPEDLIFDNSFSELFGNKLEFIWQSGTFRQSKSFSQTIALKCNPGFIFDIISKAMERIGISIDINANRSIEVITSNNQNLFVIKRFSEKKEFMSIYEVCRYLRSH